MGYDRYGRCASCGGRYEKGKMRIDCDVLKETVGMEFDSPDGAVALMREVNKAKEPEASIVRRPRSVEYFLTKRLVRRIPFEEALPEHSAV